MLPIRELFSTRKSEKDEDWFKRVVTFVRLNWSPLISQQEAERGMAYLLSQQSMAPIEALFQNLTRLNLTNQGPGSNNTTLFNGLGQAITPSTASDEAYMREMRGLGFKPLPVWEKLYNVLISEMKKMGVVVDVRSTDPTSVSKRVQDKSLIENKKKIEGFLSYIYTSIGQAPYRLKQHESRFGESPSNGNIEQFESMGLNSDDPTDVDFFVKFFHKLNEEIGIQDIIDNIATDNQWTLDIPKWVRDILAKKAIASTCYVSDTTGKIMTRYLAPETVFIYGGGNRQDFNDCNAKGYERKVTVKEMLDIFGNSFDMERNWPRLLQAITYTNQIEFTGLAPSYRGFVTNNDFLTGKNGVKYGYNDFMTFRVAIGRIELNSQNQEGFGEISNNSEKYPQTAKWQTPTYKAYYLVVSQLDQILFDFGELEYQDILGSTDVNVWSTICTYKEVGDSLTIQSAQIVDRINEAWYKFIYEMRRAKPRGRGWNYDSMVTTLMDLIPDTNTSSFNKLQKVMEMLDSSSNEIYTFPVIDGKTTMVPGNQLNYDIPNGMSKESMLWWEIMMSNIQYLSDMIGIAPLREGDPGNARDSMNNQFKALEYSQSATYYIPDMLTYLFQQMSIKATFFAQDIITYKTYNTMAYKTLEDAVGLEALENLESLGKTAMHRFGIFVESLNQGPLRQKVEAMIALDIQKGTISTAESLLINDIKSPKKAYLTLAHFEQRNRKLTEQAAQKALESQQQHEIQLQQLQLQGKKMEQDTILQKTKMETDAQIQGHIINQKGGIAKTGMKVAADKDNIYHQANADLQAEQKTLNDIGKTTPPPPPPPPVAPPSLPVPQGPPQSGPEQLRERTIPGSTEQQQA